MLADATIARPYARAAYEAAEAAGSLESWSPALELGARMVSTPEFRQLIGNPRIEREQVLDLFSEVAGESLEEPFANFLRILIDNRRLTLLPEIAAQFDNLRRKHEQRIKVSVVSAVELSKEQREKLAERLRDRFGLEVEMETGVDSNLLGGLVVRTGDHVIDASIRGRLEKLGRELSR